MKLIIQDSVVQKSSSNVLFQKPVSNKQIKVLTAILNIWKKTKSEISTRFLYPCFIANFNPSRCDCPLPCEKIDYQVQSSIAYSPSSHLWDTLLPLYNVAPNDTEKVREYQEYVR